MTAVLDRTANEIIRSALRASGIIRPDRIPKAADTATGLEILNNLTKRWQAQGRHLWAQTEGVVFMDAGKESYLLGPSGDEATKDDDLITTTTTADLAALATTVSLTDTTGMLGAANLITISPISTQFWTATLATITEAGVGIRIANSGAAAGNGDFDLTTIAADEYRVEVGYTVGTSSSAVISVIDPTDSTVLATETVSASATVVLDFTATQTTLTLRVKNVSTTSGHTSEVSDVQLFNDADGDKIGIKQDDNTRHWTTIKKVDSSTQVTINTGMVSVAASGAQVFTFTTIIDRPLRIYNERSATIGQNNEIPAFKWSRQEYMQQPLKSGQGGTVTQLYYSPQLTNGRLYVWQTASNCNQVVRFTFDRPLQIASSQTDNPEFPSEWFDALKWNVALEMIPEYSVPAARAQEIRVNATESLEDALDFDEEQGDLNVQPDLT